MTQVLDLSKFVSTSRACKELGACRSTFYRSLKPATTNQQTGSGSFRALSAWERQKIVDVFCSEKYASMSTREAHFSLLDSGLYFGSLRTIYRVLSTAKLSRDKRNQRQAGKYHKPVLRTTAPNQVWTWDITELKSHLRGEKYYLFTVIDIFSRYVTGWMIDVEASAEHGQKLVLEACLNHEVSIENLTLHSDRGSQMRAQSWDDFKALLGITRSFSRPRVSNDNPFVESSYKTLKYCPEYPGKFTSLLDAQAFLQLWFNWYNKVHHHSGIADFTPESVHFDRYKPVLAKRQSALNQAYLSHPERFVNGKPTVSHPPKIVSINGDDKIKKEVI